MDWERMCRELQKRVEELENENRELRRSLGLPDAERSRIDAPELPAIAGAGVDAAGILRDSIIFNTLQIALLRSYFSILR